MKTNPYAFRLCCLIMSFSFITSSLYSQEKNLEFNIGAAPTLDAVHVGINFNITPELDLGASVGTILIRDYINIGIETRYKFGESKRVKLKIIKEERTTWVKAKTWYGGLRMNIVSDKKRIDFKRKYIYITPAIGRHFNINRTIGLNMDIGLSFTASQVTTYSGNSICHQCFVEKHPQYPLLPTARIQFFIKN